MKKTIIILSILFLIYTVIVNFCPVVTQWDENLIVMTQSALKDIPVEIPRFISSEMFHIMLIAPLIAGVIFFIRKYLILDIIILCSSPFVAKGFNYIFKKIIARPRPPIELQIGHHSDSYSYVSNHTFITFCLWGVTAYYINLYCKNKFLKWFLLVFALVWVLLEGFSRIWLGVHNPTDVIGGYFLGTIFVLIYIELAKIIGGK